ncbi:NUDIX hydrolase [Flavihumibacter fluvii]|uniref:NUDIX hydrolase n=1 Tax=Flavihumibacter fluvii TaxID=2838157 RepID=UPI001BDE95AC|nr:NUDIX domain-containing protein [Flavihumibacter fluvii]ULQ53636.1 NUDIX domain-containing protein [Flavihumibacter fluvii]
MVVIPAAALLVVHERKLLLAYSSRKSAWYLPGGKVDAGESAEEALVREIREELNCHLDINNLGWFMEVVAPAFGEPEGYTIQQQCFFYHGNLDPQASGEISELRFFSKEAYLKEPQKVVGVLMVLDELKKEGYL